MEQSTRRALQAVLDHHAELRVESEGTNVCVFLKKTRTNLLGNFPGGEIAYLANAAAGLHCIATEAVAETVSLSIDFLERADAQELMARCTTVKSGRSLIRLRVDISVRRGGVQSLVAIAQVTLKRIDDPAVTALLK